MGPICRRSSFLLNSYVLGGHSKLNPTPTGYQGVLKVHTCGFRKVKIIHGSQEFEKSQVTACKTNRSLLVHSLHSTFLWGYKNNQNRWFFDSDSLLKNQEPVILWSGKYFKNHNQQVLTKSDTHPTLDNTWQQQHHKIVKQKSIVTMQEI
jgi:hypothetical protein